jgi:hypothetical protein
LTDKHRQARNKLPRSKQMGDRYHYVTLANAGVYKLATRFRHTSKK